jgi:hypothetical protein
MKNIKYIIGLFLTLAFFASCEEEKYEFGDLTAPSNVQIADPEIEGQNLNVPELMYGDGTGFVTFKATADNVISYSFNFGDGSNQVVPSGVVKHRYTKVGVNTFTVIVTAIGKGGVSSSKALDVEVYSSFSDADAENLLNGGVIGAGKTWYWAANIDVHVGLGPVFDNYGGKEFAWPNWWNAIKAWDAEKFCMYDDEFVFTKTAEGMTFEQTNGVAFIPGTYASVLGVAGDTCHGEDVVPTMYGVKEVSLFPSSSKAALEGDGLYFGVPTYRGTSFEISDGGFLGWYVGASTYDIISVTADKLIVRIIQPGNGFAWYQVLTSTKPVQGSGNESAFTKEVWSDEFETAGAPDPEKWTYDLGKNGGWGNQEVQTYTKNAENVIVADGILKITAKKETDGSYTSARLKTQGLYSFKYGRIDIKAKLPKAAGTWPALWMLGDNINVVGWPQCGEIDIMEQKGDDKVSTLGTFHWWNTTDGVYGSFGEKKEVLNSSTEFHVYSLEWTKDKVTVIVDGSTVVAMDNKANLPFNEKFFLVMNVAMGGTLGGAIDPAFTQDSMEIEYIKVFQ